MTRLEITEDHIAIFHDGEELIYWDIQEWMDDPLLVLTIAHAIQLLYTDGIEELRCRLPDPIIED